AALKQLEIRDAKTDLLVYRRPGVEPLIPMKVFRLEFQMLPMIRFDHHCGRHFHYELPAIERFGNETALQAFHLNAVKSIYLSGRVFLRNFEEFFDKGFQMIGYLPDPYFEMSTRLAILKRLAHSHVTFLPERDRMALSP